MNQELIEYIRDERADGISISDIKAGLIAGGWEEADVNEAIVTLESIAPQHANPIAPIAAPIVAQSTVPVATPIDAQKQAPVSAVVTTPISSAMPSAEDLIKKSVTAKPQMGVSYNHPKAQSNGGSKKIAVAIGVLSTLLFVGGASAYYFLWSGYKPEEVVSKMLERWGSAKTFTYAGEIKVKATVGSALDVSQNSQPSFTAVLLDAVTAREAVPVERTTNVSMQFEGSSDIGDSAKPKNQMLLTLNSENMGTGFSVNVSAGVETRFIDSVLYGRFTQLPSFGAELSAFKDKWIKVDIKGFQDQLQSQLGSSYQDEFEKAKKEAEITPDQAKQMQDAIQKSGAWKITEILGGEKIDGVDTYHYAFEVDKAKLADLVKALYQIRGIQSVPLDSLNGAMDIFQSIHGELWIGKPDFLLRKLTFDIDVKGSQVQVGSGAGNISGVVTFANLGKPVQIDIPENAQDLMQIFNQSMQAAQLRVRDTKKVQALFEAEGYIASYNKKCGYYPGKANCGSKFTKIKDWKELSSVLVSSKLTAGLAVADTSSSDAYGYVASNDGLQYVMSTKLEDKNSFAIMSTAKGNVLGVDCDTLYCVAR